jgi:predicted RNA-binding Zn ribbon-like protein
MTTHLFDLSGGHLALDFANSMGGSRARPNENLFRYEDLIEWAGQAGAIDDGDRRRLARAAEGRSASAAKVFRRALDLREAIFRAFDARAAGRAVPADAIATIDHEDRIAAAHRALRPRDGGAGFEWDDDPAALDRPLWPIALAASDLLVARDVPVIKECASATCDWLFIDRSRNRSRRWCDMRDCGNREKVRRFYSRERAKRSPRR